MTAFGAEQARIAAGAIRERLGQFKQLGHFETLGGDVPMPVAAIVLGSGLGGLADDIEQPARIPFAEIPGFPAATVAGHAGALIAGTLAGKFVLALAGRFHVYEGHDARLAAFPARVVHALGASTLIVSNAAGGINRMWQPGDLMLIRDHINLTFRNPLAGAVEPGDGRFPDMSDPYDVELIEIARSVAGEQGIVLREGVYAGLTGPAYETPAEVRMLAVLGADAVGMSTVPEVIVARAIGMRVAGFSCVTNLASGLSNNPITHADVLESSARSGDAFKRLVTGVVARL